MIQIIDVCKSFDGNRVLEHINLAIHKGQITVVIGKSGVGKSVLLKHIIGLFKPDSGQVLVDGQDINQLRGRQLREFKLRLSVLFQGGALFDSLNVFENIAFPLREKTRLSEAEIARRVRERLEQMNLTADVERKFPDELSGGMKKRVAVARAMIQEPEIILFDEPVTGLDPPMSNTVFHFIKKTHDDSGGGAASVIGSGLRVPPRFAACANGVGVHADDYDDTQLAVAKDRVYGLLTHPTAPALPSVLSVAEATGRSGKDLLTAYHVGVEVECKIAEAINPRHYQHGFHSTSTCGALGAAAGVANLVGLSVDQARTCLGIAGSLAAGVRENFGTMMKPFHAGRAAESGVIAAEFAQLGLTATPIVLEAGRGFFRAAGGGYDEPAILGKLGKPWTFADPGISIKPHPSGSLTHPGMTKLLELIRKHDIKPEQVVSLKVGTNQNMPNALIHHRPTTEL